MHPIIKPQEEFQSKIPAMVLLCNLGWRYVPPQQALAGRNGDLNAVVLVDVLRKTLKQRTFLFEGQSHSLSEKSVDYLIEQICNPPFENGLLHANETIYNHLCYGIAVTEFIQGKKATPTIPLIDWENPQNNQFDFTEEFSVRPVVGGEPRRPDLVCFVNGLPLVVIEAKRPEAKAGKGISIDEGISQHLRNQRADEIPSLFAFSQLLLAINGIDGKYATCLTRKEFWQSWREERISEAEMTAIKNKNLPENDRTLMFTHRKPEALAWFEQWCAKPLAVSGQDELLISLLSPSRLLEFVRAYTLFVENSPKYKLVARYQQFFATKTLIEQLSPLDENGSRQGGVIWHTQGSGKSFTMVLLSKAILLDPTLKHCRFIVITDRVDLERQLSKTFFAGGELQARNGKLQGIAKSGKALALKIGRSNERFIFSLVQKFNTAIKQPECYNDSPNLIVLIDEAHRSQGGENYQKMRQALPNAAFVAFTGTPLLKQDKTTQKFGNILHAYTMQTAVDDGTVAPLLYEERIPELDVNDRAIDAWFERVTQGLSLVQKANLKRKFSHKQQIYAADNRIHLIAFDIATHLGEHIASPLKGQLACDSKSAAIKYQQYINEIGLFESAVVISPPDTREGNTAVDESTLPDVVRWWKNNVGTQDEKSYTEQIIRRFADPEDQLRLLIVVDKLLTGFDEPCNAVLYIDKPLKQHNLLQAVARVNRLHVAKKFGLLIDYRGILKELDTTIAKYQDLATRTQGGFDIADLDGLYQQMQQEYRRLPMLYNALWAIFADVENKQDMEQLRQKLIPKLVMQDGVNVDVNEKIRDDFYDAVTAFSSCLKIAQQSSEFYCDPSFSDDTRQHYKDSLQFFIQLRQIVQQDNGEQVDYRSYRDKIKDVVDKQVSGVKVRESDARYDVSKMGKQEVETWSEPKTRNETDLIRTRVTRMIEQELQDDPYAQTAFSDLLRQTIAEAEKLFDHPLKQYYLFDEFEQKVRSRKLDDLPDVFGENLHAQAFFGVFKLVLPETLANPQQQTHWQQQAFEIDRIVTEAVAMYSVNPQSLEAHIRQQLLPKIFQQCKQIGAGIEQAKAIVDQVVQIVLVGVTKNAQ